MTPITAKEFNTRIEALCLNRTNPGLPRKRRDQLILLQSIMLTLDPQNSYAETDINEVIERWLTEVGRAVDSDHVTLRRLLVDEGWLVRDPAGQIYQVDNARTDELFEPDVKKLDPRQIVTDAETRRTERKRRYLGRK